MGLINGRQYLGNLGKIDNGVVSVTSLWADEQVYYPLETEPYTPESYFAKGRNDAGFRTKLKIAFATRSHSTIGIDLVAMSVDDVVVTGDDGGTVATIERVSSLGWLSRVSLRLPGGETLVAHIPNEDLHGAGEGASVRVDLRNPKAFMAPERDEATIAS